MILTILSNPHDYGAYHSEPETHTYLNIDTRNDFYPFSPFFTTMAHKTTKPCKNAKPQKTTSFPTVEKVGKMHLINSIPKLK